MQGLIDLEKALKHIIGDELVFKGFTDTPSLYKQARSGDYDVIFANMELFNRSGMQLFLKLRLKHPANNFIGIASKARHSDAVTLMRYHASGYIKKPYDIETLSESLSHLRFPIAEE